MAVDTRERVLAEALLQFANNGYAATSLDDVASRVGVTKQAIIYHFANKESLLRSVIDVAVGELGEAFAPLAADNTQGFARVEETVRATFRLAVRRPEVLSLVRNVTQQGDDASTWLASGMAIMVERAHRFLEQEMDAGRLRRLEPRMLLLAVYSAVIGVATEPEVMRMLGVEPDIRSLVRARSEVLQLLRAALVPAEHQLQ
ncbi:MAG: AcrR family transcriptional regulator [Candidatus Poriferisodalaceae bacterium]|jgi:AcrR family transcriptional regulator